MINGLEGIPGSGKSYEAVVYHVLIALKAGRRVVTNLPLVIDLFAAIDPAYRDLIETRHRPRPIMGTWDANRMDDQGNGKAFELWPDARTEPASESVAVFGHVWDYFHTWKHPQTGQGPLYVIDECHIALPCVGTDVQVVQWFKLHRHFNADVLLMTQNFRDMCPPIARLLAMMTRCRKADFLGKSGKYIRKVHAGFRGALVSSEERAYLPQYFALYKSHTQGNSVGESGASDVSPFIVKFKRATWAWFIIGGGLSVFWFFHTLDKGKPVSRPPGAIVQEGLSAPLAVAPAVRTPASGVKGPQSAAAASSTDEEPEPLLNMGLHLKGMATIGTRSVWMLVVSQNGQPVQDFTDADLRAAGYGFRASGPCTALVEWKGRPRAISCDLPSVNLVNVSKKA